MKREEDGKRRISPACRVENRRTSPAKEVSVSDCEA